MRVITYRDSDPLTPEAFIDLLKRSGLAARRPVDNPASIAGMLKEADLLVTAWDGDLLVGVCRSVTDFHFACYLSDLAVDQAYQNQGIGRALDARTRARLAPGCKVILLAAPAAADYYPHLGYTADDRCWVRMAGD